MLDLFSEMKEIGSWRTECGTKGRNGCGESMWTHYPQLGYHRWYKAFDQLDLNEVVHDEARNHRKSKDGNYLPPR